MAKMRPSDPKVDALKRAGSLNPDPGGVTDPSFDRSDFFDRRDLVQVKYEMVRRVQVEGEPVSRSAAAFGFSRPSFYQAQDSLEREGLPGLLPKKRGPRGPHKLGAEAMSFLAGQLATEPSLSSAELALRLEAHNGLRVHPRSIERALAREEKKRP